MIGKTFLELAQMCAARPENKFTPEDADRLRKQWLAQYPDLARFFEFAERKPPVQDRGFLDGEGTYRVKLLSRGTKQTHGAGPVYIAEFQILESNNERHPVGAIRSYARNQSRYPGPPNNLTEAPDGATMNLRTRVSATRAGLPFTIYSWTPVRINPPEASIVFDKPHRIVSRVQDETIVEPTAAYGATCKRCNTFNEHAETRADFVCFGCK